MWQTVRIPFSDFLLVSMGYVQNEQAMINTTAIRSLGISIADRIDGPFRLDVRSIKAITMDKEVSDMDYKPEIP